MKHIGVIRTKETSTIEVEAASYEEGRVEIASLVPEGYQLLEIHTEKS